jgi:hypothetical protein
MNRWDNKIISMRQANVMMRAIQVGLLVLGLGVGSAAPALAGTIGNVGGGAWS